MTRSTDAIEPLVADLNPPQRLAVLHTDGPLLILAGPGSGKTRVVTRRAAHLALTVARPRQILAITFTNKAAKEMRERIAALDVAPGMIVSTFHALCARLLREYAEQARVPRNFTIFDRDDRRKLLKQAIEECDLSTERLTPSAADTVIGHAKNAMQTATQFAAQANDWRERQFAKVYLHYEKLLNDQGGLDFDDLLMRVALSLSENDELRGELSRRFRYLLIDEYQDTNAAQYLIAQKLAEAHHNICATGDPDQSIYGWRGANIENILSFERDYPSATVVRLEQNYRSTKRILAAADALIAGNLQRKAKRLWTDNDDGLPIRVVEVESGDEEARYVADQIARALHDGTGTSDIAIFYRINALSRTIEEAFLRKGIPYQIARGVEFYNRKEVKDVLAYLRVLVNPADEVSLLRIINTPARGIGDTTVRRLVERARQSGRGVYGELGRPETVDALGRSAARVQQFALLLGKLGAALELPPPQALDFVISQSGLRAMYAADGDSAEDPSANLDELVSAASAFHHERPEATLVQWLEHAALISDVDAVKDGSGAVTLMTLHAAKGLEFDVVYMIGLEDGLLPFRRHDDSGVDEEEERRLCFVGITRARKQLTLLRSRYRMIRGVTERTVRSPFLDELPGDQVECQEEEQRRDRKSRADATVGKLPADIAEWGVGTLVRHPEYGLGQIQLIYRGASRTHVDVHFQEGSRHSLILEHADLTRVDFDDVD